MKHYILAATLSLVAVPGWADECLGVRDMAFEIMKARTLGLERDVVERLADADGLTSDSWTVKVVDAAYGEPDREGITNLIALDFSTRMAMECIAQRPTQMVGTNWNGLEMGTVVE